MKEVELQTENVNTRLNLRIISLQVIDVNDPPTSISLLSERIYENATAGTVVGVMQAQDEDANQSHYFQLISSQGMFRITGYSTVKAGLYVEAALRVQSKYLQNSLFCRFCHRTKQQQQSWPEVEKI